MGVPRTIQAITFIVVGAHMSMGSFLALVRLNLQDERCLFTKFDQSLNVTDLLPRYALAKLTVVYRHV